MISRLQARLLFVVHVCRPVEELKNKAADRTECQGLVEKLGEATGEVDDSDESTTETEDYYS